ncbi:hypothetical protein WK24_27515 [Burkholderia vietnamiensis]|nr:hypothetical protein WK24_27515 [Burkholderia vietnamiensis]
MIANKAFDLGHCQHVMCPAGSPVPFAAHRVDKARHQIAVRGNHSAPLREQCPTIGGRTFSIDLLLNIPCVTMCDLGCRHCDLCISLIGLQRSELLRRG